MKERRDLGWIHEECCVIAPVTERKLPRSWFRILASKMMRIISRPTGQGDTARSKIGEF
jgi:hypothetical protein